MRRFRFAPSPNGLLHLGHAYSALLNHQMARKADGEFLLRIEDIDVTRCRLEHEQAIHVDLTWLGITWDELPVKQSERFQHYRDAADRLFERGLLYRCFATRGEIRTAIAENATRDTWPNDPDGSPIYPGLHRTMPEAEQARRITAGEAFAMRLNMERALNEVGGADLGWTETATDTPAQLKPAVWGDVVIIRKDVPASYHLACVLDDADQGITDVVRGMDLFHATALHRLLQVLLGLPAPHYHHHRLILDEDGRKLSKTNGDTGLSALREQGVTPAQIRQRLGIS